MIELDVIYNYYIYYYFFIQEEKKSVEVFFDIFEQTEKDFKQFHVWSSILTEMVRKFGWNDLDPTRDIKIKNTLIQISNVSEITLTDKIILFDDNLIFFK